MNDAFQVVVLGCSGGPRENDLSGYLLSSLQDPQWIALDAGTLLGGIDCALQKNSLKDVLFTDTSLTPAGEMLIKHIKCYLISHAHLDHILGLVLNSQSDVHKCILGIDPTINNLRDHVFNALIWPNYGSEGVEPVLNRYTYIRLPLHKPQPIPETSLTVEAFLLSHPHGYPSTAFLIEKGGRYVLYFGDTSSDVMEVEKHLNRIWNRIGPLIKENKLHGMLLECSFSLQEGDQVIFGHLDPKLMTKELRNLAEIAGTSLKGFKVVVTHRKESLKSHFDAKEQIKEELLSLNSLGIEFIFPTQGERITL